MLILSSIYRDIICCTYFLNLSSWFIVLCIYVMFCNFRFCLNREICVRWCWWMKWSSKLFYYVPVFADACVWSDLQVFYCVIITWYEVSKLLLKFCFPPTPNVKEILLSYGDNSRVSFCQPIFKWVLCCDVHCWNFKVMFSVRIKIVVRYSIRIRGYALIHNVIIIVF